MKNILIAFILLAAVVSMTACSAAHVLPASDLSAAPETFSRPETTVPETVSPETAAVPVLSTVPETSAPETTVPGIAAPETAEPEPTTPADTKPQSEAVPTTQPAAAAYFLNELNYAPDLNQVTVKPGYVRYEDGRLIADCFVINGMTNKTVYNIRVNSLEFYDRNGQLIAGASFGALDDLVLGPNQYVVWTFSFSGDAVANALADLSYLDCRSETDYYY